MSLLGLDHIGFAVSDLDRSVAWYTELLQHPPRLRKTWDVEYIGRVVGYPGCRMECAYWELPDRSTLELIQYLEPSPGRVDMEPRNTGNAHLCLITEDLRGEFERLRAQARFRHPEPVEIPWGPYAGGITCYAVDPDGILIQLMQPPPHGKTARKPVMEFLVQIDVGLPPEMPEIRREKLLAAERARGRDLLRQGTISDIWRIPGRTANCGIWRAADATELNDALSSLPLWPWFRSVQVTPLATHPVHARDTLAPTATEGA